MEKKVGRDQKFAKIVLIEYADEETHMILFSALEMNLTPNLQIQMHLLVKSHEETSGDGFSVMHVMTYPSELQTLLFCYLHER